MNKQPRRRLPWLTAALVVAVVVANVAALGYTLADSRDRAPALSAISGSIERTVAEPADEDGEGEVRLTATPTAGGNLRVEERISASRAIRQLTLSAPEPLKGAGRPRVTELEVLVDGRPVEAVTSFEVGRVLTLPAPTQEVRLRYVLQDALRRSDPRPDRRALLQLAPLVTTSAGLTTAVVEIAGADVLNLVCPERPLDSQMCGRAYGDLWQTSPIPLREATVVAQVDLPKTSSG